MNSLTFRGISAAKWNSIGSAVRAGLQFGIGIVLARLVGPQEFGLIAIAFIMIGFGQLFVDFGFNAAIIQSPNLSQNDVNCLGSLQIFAGAAMTFVGFIISTPLAYIFKQPDAVLVIRWMSLMFLLRSFGQTSIALLSRDLDFKSVQISSLLGYILGYVIIGVAMAYFGFGVWSLVAAQLSQSFITSVVSLVQKTGIRRITLSGVNLEMLRFGRLVLSANISSWALWNIDSMIIGQVSGSTSLAFYNRASTLASSVPLAVLSGLQGVIFSAFSRAQNNPEGCRKALYSSIELVSFLILPILFSVAAVPKTVVVGLYGPEWLPAAKILTPMCILWSLTAILSLFGPLIMAFGRTELETRAQWLVVIAMIPILCLVANIFNPIWVAWTCFCLGCLRFILLLRSCNLLINIDYFVISKLIFPYFIIAISSGAGAYTVDFFVSGFSNELALFIDILVSGISLLFSTFLFRKSIIRGNLGQIILSSNLLPKALHIRLARLCTIR